MQRKDHKFLNFSSSLLKRDFEDDGAKAILQIGILNRGLRTCSYRTVLLAVFFSKANRGLKGSLTYIQFITFPMNSYHILSGTSTGTVALEQLTD